GFGLAGSYRIPNFKLDSYGVYTNTTPSGAFRGFGNAETVWAGENQMDIIARKLDCDSVEIRRKNALREGDTNALGEVTYNTGALECLYKVEKWIEGNKVSPKEEGQWRRGTGIALSNKFTRLAAPSCAIVKVYPDGVVEVRHSSDEIGQGINTVVAQIAADSFGISVDQVKVVSGNTTTCPYGWPPLSSRETFYMGNAVLVACQDAKNQLFKIAAPMLGASIEELETKDRKVYMKGNEDKEIEIKGLFRPKGLGNALGVGEIIGTGLFDIPGTPEDPETGQCERMAAYYNHGVQALEVAVNIETGQVKVLKSAACFDVGQPINPKMCEAQIESVLNQGIGTGLYEMMVLDDEGVLLNPDFTNYKIPTACDVPDIDNVAIMLTGVPHRDGPFGAKGLGEGVLLPFAPALSNAIYDAVGVRIRELPISREKVFMALKGEYPFVVETGMPEDT
ncbi:xanthine dehydrogenase family protein molybdopterin-binding subunit, partial [Chloroflexota bacterium]